MRPVCAQTTTSLCSVSIWSLDGLSAGMPRGWSGKDVSSERKLMPMKPTDCTEVESNKYIHKCYTLEVVQTECKHNVNAGGKKFHNEVCQHSELVKDLASGYVTPVCLFALCVVLHLIPSCFKDLGHNSRHGRAHDVTTVSGSFLYF